MNIKQLSTNTRTLLSIDDPSIYEGEETNTFAHIVISTASQPEDIQNADSETLYVVASAPWVHREDGQWVRLPNPFSRGPTLPYPTIDGEREIYQLNDNLIAIDNHLYALRKELSYWNLYQISYSVNSTDDFSSVLASLAPGEALIINFEGIFTYEGIQYKRGDVIVRLTNGEYVTIEGTTSGFYFPSRIIPQSGSKTYKIEYTFKAGQEPSNPGPTDIPEGAEATPLDEPAKIESYTVEGGEQEESFVYALTLAVEAGSAATDYYFDKAHYTVDPESDNPTVLEIPPVIKMYSENGEEVFLDFKCMTYEQDTSKYKITLNSKPLSNNTLKYIYIK